MMINAHTKIAALLKANPNALEAIISISPGFEKLRNPFLRKILAARTSIAMASKIGGCSVSDFLHTLQPLGFEVEDGPISVTNEKNVAPAFFYTLKKEDIIELDVRPVLSSGKDPLSLIIQQTKSILPGQTLKIINSFEPSPLIAMLEKQGFLAYADTLGDDLVETYFHKSKTSEQSPAETPLPETSPQQWEEIQQRFAGRIKSIDVRAMEMPRPMLTILEELERLPADHALFVYHKRIPVFLLPELKDRQFDYRAKEIAEGEVHLMIFKP
ncbi:MAG: DUF2249 domain-containing protein [Chitinophagaceae bacterium]|nr:DUF2249 domain-containing protein [Chitinophagaceae bacterium]